MPITLNEITQYLENHSVTNYATLPAANTVTNQLWYCINEQGSRWLFNYKSAGWYFSDGINWTHQESVFEASLSEVNTGTLTDKFVSPNTLANSTWAFTTAKVLATVLTGLNTTLTGTITSSDSILTALGKIQNSLNLKSPIASPTFTGTVTTPAIIVSSETASRVAIIDGSKNVKSADTATYPSLTEFSYTKGLTSSAQTQLDGKAALALRSYVSGGNFTTSSTTLVDITGLSVALVANSVYEIDIKMTVESSTNAGLNTGVNFSAAGATIEAGEVGARDAEVGKVVRLNNFNTTHASSAWVRVSTTPQTHEIKGIVRTGANAGNLTAQILKVSSGIATVYIDSYIRVRKV